MSLSNSFFMEVRQLEEKVKNDEISSLDAYLEVNNISNTQIIKHKNNENL
jgi:hypothetical protein